MNNGKIVIDYNKTYSTTHYGEYIIIEKLGYVNNDSRMWVRIKFLLTGYEKDIRYDYIGHDIMDPYYPRIYNIGCIGENVGSRAEYKREYDRWTSILSRCYNPADKDYKNYGGSGIRVSNEWLIFANYFNDIKYLPGYRYKIQDPLNWSLDKDYLQQGIPKNKMLYSKETCIWMPKSINSKLSVNTYKDELPYVDKYGNIKLMQLYHLI